MPADHGGPEISAGQRGVAALRVVVQDVSAFETVPSTRRIASWVRRSIAGEAEGELSIRIVGETEGAALNQHYRGRSGATNVLSFAGPELSPDIDGDARLLGDLVICAPVVAREAAVQGKAVDAHWAHIVLHGVLHLLGYDHESEDEARVMEGRETELLTALGFADPYADEH